MDFTSLKTRVAEETGLDTTVDATRLGAWVNAAYRFLSGMREWPWLFKTGIIQTTADTTTLTASVNAAATAVTLSSTVATSLANDYYIQFSTTDDWYKITAHSGGSASVTISPAYVGSTNLTSGTCIIRRVFYSLGTDVDRVINMRQAITDEEVVYVDPRDLDRQVPDPTATGTPNAYTIQGFDSSNSWHVYFFPIPDAKVNIQYRYYSKTTDLSTGSDVPLMPEKFHQAIVFTALAMFGHPYIDDSRMQSAEMRARSVVAEMVGQTSSIPHHHPVMQPWDKRIGRKPFGPQFPPEFGRGY